MALLKARKNGEKALLRTAVAMIAIHLKKWGPMDLKMT
jgi:hypothetical protein